MLSVVFNFCSPKDIEAIRHEVQRQQNDNERKLVVMATKPKSSGDDKVTSVSDMQEVETALD